jgi:hypothetical protein
MLMLGYTHVTTPYGRGCQRALLNRRSLGLTPLVCFCYKRPTASVTTIATMSGRGRMTPAAIDYFNSHSPLRGLTSRMALHECLGSYTCFVALAGTASGQCLLNLGVTPDAWLPASNLLECWYSYCSDIPMASVKDCTSCEAVFPGTRFVQIQLAQA